MFSDEAKLSVQLSRHAGGDMPLKVHSLKDHGNLTTLMDTCKGWDSVVIEVNPDQRTGKTFLPDGLVRVPQTISLLFT